MEEKGGRERESEGRENNSIDAMCTTSETKDINISIILDKFKSINNNIK